MKGSVWGKENPVPGQEAGLCFTLKNVICLPSISPCVPLSWGHPIYDHPIRSSRQPRQRVGALSVPQSPALHIQPPNPHTVLLEPFLTMSVIHRKAQDILSVSSHQPPSWSSNPGSTPYSSSFLSPPIVRGTISRPGLDAVPITASDLNLPCSKPFQQFPPSKQSQGASSDIPGCK